MPVPCGARLGKRADATVAFCRNALYGGVCRAKSCRHKTPTKHKLFVGRDVFCAVRGEIAGFVKKHAPNKRCVQLVVAVFTNAGNVVDGTQKLETTEMSDSVQTFAVRCAVFCL